MEPKKVSILGSVVKVEELASAEYVNLSNDSTVITIEQFNGESVELFLNQAMIKEFGLTAIIFEGNIVNCSVEECVANVTTYEDESGDLQYHTKDHLRCVNVANCSALSMALAGAPQFIIESVERKRTEEVAKSSAKEHKVRFGRATSTSVDEITAEIAKLETRMATAPSTLKDQYANRILELKARLPKKPADKPVDK